jgi:hypothetical protein
MHDFVLRLRRSVVGEGGKGSGEQRAGQRGEAMARHGGFPLVLAPS